MLSRAIAMTQPGMFLSQPPKASRPSWFMPPATTSMAVGDDLARHEAVAHALVAHHDAVGGGRGAEDLRHAAAGADALAALAGQAVEVGVAGRDVAEQRGDADHRPVEVVVVEADGPQHGPVGRAAHALGGQQAGAIRL